MVSVRLPILLTVAAVVACASSASDKHIEDVIVDNNAVIDETQWSDEEFEDQVDEEDGLFATDLDIQNEKVSKVKRSIDDYDTIIECEDCWVRTLFKTGRTPSWDADKVVKTLVKKRNTINIYQMSGSLNDALEQFHCAKPRKVTKSLKHGVNVHIGKIGRNRITVKYGGSHGTPTLQTHSPKPNGGVHIRVFMYED